MTVIAPPAAEPLDDEYDALLGRLAHEPLGDSASLRARLVPELRALLDRGRAEAQARLIADGDGLACARRLSDVMDGAVRLVHDAVVRHLYPADNPSAGEKLAVVATGGYGRGTLAPGSDVDLLFLLPYKQTAWGESVVEAMLYVLWDLKLKVGHATRSVDECIREARADMTIRTALLEARFLFGDAALFDELVARYDAEIVQGHGRRVRRRQAARARRGASRRPARRATSSSPTSRTARAGLRDLNTLFWIAKYVYRVREVGDLVEAGLFNDGGGAALPALRGVPVARALPHALRDRPRGGAPGLRPAAPDRRAHRLWRSASGRLGRRALHEVLFPGRQGCRRPHRHRLRGA